jgi:hypothetical protein
VIKNDDVKTHELGGKDDSGFAKDLRLILPISKGKGWATVRQDQT